MRASYRHTAGRRSCPQPQEMDDGPRTSDATRESGRTLAQEIIEAYSGMKRWNRVSSLRVDIAFAGFAFRMKFLPRQFGKWSSAWVSSAVKGSSGIRWARGVSQQMMGR